jgi:23S rRNA (adenine2503-C2)-methyltransferase
LSVSLDLSRAAAPPSRSGPPAKLNLSGLTRAGLAAALVEGEICPPDKARMRAGQLWLWMHHRGVTDFDRMTNVAKDTRALLADRFVASRPEVAERQVSADGTRKWLIRYAPGIEAETVYIPDVGRAGALCVSSQVGCTLNCTFCHTGTQALVRSLSNVVFMGMGEPLYNLDNVADAMDVISDNEGLALSRRRITVSTSGVVPQLKALGERTGAMLAISLHATNDALRDELVPINRAYPLKDLMAGIRAYPGLSNARRVTFEYVMLKGINDSPAEARALINLIKGLPAKINLIPFNPWPGSPYECSSWSTIEAFAAIVNKAGYASPIRTPRGRDILAACGQLRSESEKMRASEKRKLEAG